MIFRECSCAPLRRPSSALAARRPPGVQRLDSGEELGHGGHGFSMRLIDAVSPPLRPFLSRSEWSWELFETRATCDRCIQARGPTAIYKDTLKCCTFFPFVPNFSIGAILESDLEGRLWLEDRLRHERNAERASLEERSPLERRSRDEAVVVPLGLFPSLEYQQRFHSRQPEGYGNDESLLCPHYQKASGRCGVWRHRPAPCIAFHCESSYGLAGIEFWAKFEKYISALELTLAEETLLRLGLTAPEIALSRRFLPRFGSPDPHGYKGPKLRAEEARSWFEWGSDRPTFFRRCYEIVTQIEPEEILRLLGAEGQAIERELLEVRLPQVIAGS